jgi:hypothetical protein
LRSSAGEADATAREEFDLLCTFSFSALRKWKNCGHRICKFGHAMFSVPHLLLARVPLHHGARACGSLRLLRNSLREVSHRETAPFKP